MKNSLLTLLLLVVCTLGAQAQDYGKIEWDILRLGYAIPSAEGAGGGFNLGSEIRYNVNNRISAGLRGELALLVSVDEDGESGEISASSATLLVGDYYFKDYGKSRAFAGIGLGLYSGGSFDTDVEESDLGSSFGVCPRVGYELGFLRLSAEYNLAFKKGITNYFSINAGFTIGGRYKGDK